MSELEQKLKQLRIANQKLERNSRGSIFESVQDHKAYTEPSDGDAAAIVEETTLIRLQQIGNGGASLTLNDSSFPEMTASAISGSSPTFSSSMSKVTAMFVLLFLMLKM